MDIEFPTFSSQCSRLLIVLRACLRLQQFATHSIDEFPRAEADPDLYGGTRYLVEVRWPVRTFNEKRKKLRNEKFKK